jgi:hypothetical protein
MGKQKPFTAKAQREKMRAAKKGKAESRGSKLAFLCGLLRFLCAFAVKGSDCFQYLPSRPEKITSV